MSALPRMLTSIFCLAILPALAAAAPPQPPLTNASLQELRDGRSVVYGLRDNAFLHDEAAQEFSAQVGAWKGAAALLNMEVQHVTKEAVVCSYRSDYGQITIRNEQPAAATSKEPERAFLSLRIGDVVPLDVARRLRARDVVVVKGVVERSSNPPGSSVSLEIGKGQVVALVTRAIADDTGRTLGPRYYDDLRTPHYPHDALDAGEGGEVVFSVVDRTVTLASSAGNSRLDEAVHSAMLQHQGGVRLFQGKHRFTFKILPR